MATRRPFYDEDLQKSCFEVRRRNCGVDGKPILFYSRRPVTTLPARKPKKIAAVIDDKHADLRDGLKALGLATVTAAQVAEAVKNLYPQGVAEGADGEVLRAVFLHLRRQNSGDNLRQ